MWRGAVFFVLWLGLAGAGVDDLLVGLLATAAATWTSFELIPQRPIRFSAGSSLRLLFRLTGQSFHAGCFVALRALDPRLPIVPGFVTYRTALPAGPARNAFMTMECLLPGSMPVACAADGAITLHTLDVRRAVASPMAEDEALLRRVGGLGTPG